MGNDRITGRVYVREYVGSHSVSLPQKKKEVWIRFWTNEKNGA